MKVLLIVYDNDSYIHWFPQGLAYIAAVLKKEHDEVTIYNQDQHHYPDGHITYYLDKNRFDVVGVSITAGYYQYRKLLRISEAVNKSKNRPFYIIGGHGPAPEPEFFIKKTKADAVVIGEGEVTIIELLSNIANKKSLKDILGIAFKEGDKIVVNEKRPLIKEIDALPLPAYELFPMSYYRLLRMPHANNNDFVMPVLSGRGCPFKCTFCYRMDEGFRPRSNKSIIEEIKFLKNKYSITYIAFSDELLMSSKERVVKLCEDFLRHNLNIKYDCNGRLNYVEPKVLKLMKRSGCVFINYGIEALDDNVLKNMRKALRVEQIVKGIEATLKAGISPGLNIIFGNIGDSKETLDKGVEFLLKYDDGAQMRTIRPVTPYPGCELYYYCIKKGVIKDCEDFYEKKHVNSDLMTVNLTDMSDNEFHKSLLNANSRLINNYFERRRQSVILQAEKLYKEKSYSFRGFRQS